MSKQLGGGKVAHKHFCRQNFPELQETFRLPDGNDEFLEIYQLVVDKILTRV